MTRVLFDTSVLVATMLEDHPHHSKCFAWLQRVRTEEIKGFISTHSIAELFIPWGQFERSHFPKKLQNSIEKSYNQNISNLRSLFLQ